MNTNIAKSATQDSLQRGEVGIRYERLKEFRQQPLDRARECAKLTLPFILPPEGHTEVNVLPTPYNGLGAEAINNLANRLLITQLPPNQTFFSLKLSEDNREDFAGVNKADLDAALIKLENSILEDIERFNIRKAAFFMFSSLIVTGNCAIFLDSDEKATSGLKVYKMDSYVVRRDYEGNMQELIIKESVAPDNLPNDILEEVEEKNMRPIKKDCNVDLYTYVRKNEEDKWVSSREVGKVIFGEKTYASEKVLPYRALRYTSISGEHYGRGLVEFFFGDFKSIEALAKMLLEGAAASAKVVFLVKEGLTRISEVARARNGSFVAGDPESVKPLHVNKGNDFSVAENRLLTISQRLGRAFLLTSSIQRNAERVTAEEIREMANELENSLGGVYTTFANEFQLPLVNILLARRMRRDDATEIFDKLIPTVTSGIDALGRTKEFMDLQTFLSSVQSLLGPEGAAFINNAEVVKRLANATNVKETDLIKSPEQVQQEMQAAQATQMINNVAPQATKAILNGGQQNG